MSFLWLTCPTTSLHSLHCSLKFEQAKLCPSSPIKFPGGERSSRNAGWSNSLLIDQTCSTQKCCLRASSSYVPRLLWSALILRSSTHCQWQQVLHWVAALQFQSCRFSYIQSSQSHTIIHHQEDIWRVKSLILCCDILSCPCDQNSHGFPGLIHINQELWIPRLPKH